MSTAYETSEPLNVSKYLLHMKQQNLKVSSEHGLLYGNVITMVFSLSSCVEKIVENNMQCHRIPNFVLFPKYYSCHDKETLFGIGALHRSKCHANNLCQKIFHCGATLCVYSLLVSCLVCVFLLVLYVLLRALWKIKLLS